MNPVYARALIQIWKSGLEHTCDFERNVDLIGQLLDAEEEVYHIDQIHEYLQ